MSCSDFHVISMQDRIPIWDERRKISITKNTQIHVWETLVQEIKSWVKSWYLRIKMRLQRSRLGWKYILNQTWWIPNCVLTSLLKTLQAWFLHLFSRLDASSRKQNYFRLTLTPLLDMSLSKVLQKLQDLKRLSSTLVSRLNMSQDIARGIPLRILCRKAIIS